MFYRIVLHFFLFTSSSEPSHHREIGRVHEYLVESRNLYLGRPFRLVTAIPGFLVHGTIDIVPIIINPDGSCPFTGGHPEIQVFVFIFILLLEERLQFILLIGFDDLEPGIFIIYRDLFRVKREKGGIRVEYACYRVGRCGGHFGEILHDRAGEILRDIRVNREVTRTFVT